MQAGQGSDVRYEIIFEGMKKYFLGMKKIRFLQKNIFIP